MKRALQILFDKSLTEGEKKGLAINNKKTETKVLPGKKNPRKGSVKGQGISLRQADTCEYLGAQVESGGTCSQEQNMTSQNKLSKK